MLTKTGLMASRRIGLGSYPKLSPELKQSK